MNVLIFFVCGLCAFVAGQNIIDKSGTRKRSTYDTDNGPQAVLEEGTPEQGEYDQNAYGKGVTLDQATLEHDQGTRVQAAAADQGTHDQGAYEQAVQLNQVTHDQTIHSQGAYGLQSNKIQEVQGENLLEVPTKVEYQTIEKDTSLWSNHTRSRWRNVYHTR